MLCSSCGGILPTTARFCPHCGTPQAGGDEERRVVTVLFADLVGFTAMAERSDPEEVKRLVDRMFARLVREITSFGGVVDKLLGDGIVALFGAPVSHEDDAERAVRAGLRMQQTLADMRVELDLPVQMRIGVNTGLATVGGIGHPQRLDYTVIGDTVNTAKRLESTAYQPGQVVVGPATREALGDGFECEELEEFTLKGKEQKVRPYRVISAPPKDPGSPDAESPDAESPDAGSLGAGSASA